MDKINQVKQLISEINRLHYQFSNDYFETGKIEKINLSRTITHVPTPHIYRYRLTLHESINDYLMTANIDIRYFYRVKTRESIDDKIERFSNREDQYPVNNWLNDIFGACIILTIDEINAAKTREDALVIWKENKEKFPGLKTKQYDTAKKLKKALLDCLEDDDDEEEEVPVKKAKKEEPVVLQSSEKTTLGDIQQLADLKDQLINEAAEKMVKAEKAKKEKEGQRR